MIDITAVVLCAGITAAWYLGGREEPDKPTGPTEPTAVLPHDDQPVATPFPIEAFSVNLWYTAPEPARVVVPTPPPAPRLRLLGISPAETGYRAMLLDEVTDEIIRAQVGDDVNGVMLTDIDQSGVRGTFRGTEIELRLDGGEG